MSLTRIKAILLHEYYILTGNLSTVNDVFFYPVMSIVIFGFLAVYLAGVSSRITASYVLMGIILWQIVSLTQYSISVGCLWDIWSRNLTNIFITPIKLSEYLTAYIISGSLKAITVIILGGIISNIFFHISILDLGWTNLIIYFISLVMFAFAFGIFILGILFRYGNRVQSLAWGLINFLQPLMAVFYPASVLPQPLRSISFMFPPTYIFEALREYLSYGRYNWKYIIISFILNILYTALAILFFKKLYKASKISGEFAKLEL